MTDKAHVRWFEDLGSGDIPSVGGKNTSLGEMIRQLKEVRIGINGLGRIGRGVFRHVLEREDDVQLVAVNDLVDLEDLAYLARNDSVYGRVPEVRVAAGAPAVGGERIAWFSEQARRRFPGKMWGPMW